MSGLSAHEVHHPGAQSMVKAELALMWSLGGYVDGRFPCNNPCSLMRRDLATLRKYRHWIGEKTDGVRMYLLLGWLPSRADPYAFLIDRTCKLIAVSLSVRVPSAYYDGSLFDGELVARDDGSYEYVVFDCVASCGLDYKAQFHPTRMRAVERAFKDGVFQFQEPLIASRVKEWKILSRDAALQLQPLVEQGVVDGVILARENAPLRLGMQTDMLKWKPATKHTIDFVWRDGQLLLRDGEHLVSPSHIVLHFDTDTSAYPTECVLECEFTSKDAPWIARVVKVRADKTEPNSVHVAELTLQNIEEAIRFDELYATE